MHPKGGMAMWARMGDAVGWGPVAGRGYEIETGDERVCSTMYHAQASEKSGCWLTASRQVSFMRARSSEGSGILVTVRFARLL